MFISGYSSPRSGCNARGKRQHTKEGPLQSSAPCAIFSHSDCPCAPLEKRAFSVSDCPATSQRLKNAVSDCHLSAILASRGEEDVRHDAVARGRLEEDGVLQHCLHLCTRTREQRRRAPPTVVSHTVRSGPSACATCAWAVRHARAEGAPSTPAGLPNAGSSIATARWPATEKAVSDCHRAVWRVS